MDNRKPKYLDLHMDNRSSYPALLFIQGPGYKIMKDLFLFMPNRIEKHLYFFFPWATKFSLHLFFGNKIKKYLPVFICAQQVRRL